jgi:hypothetical protein
MPRVQKRAAQMSEDEIQCERLSDGATTERLDADAAYYAETCEMLRRLGAAITIVPKSPPDAAS